MTESAPRHGGFTTDQLQNLLVHACAILGLDPEGATVLRGHSNAVVRLASAPVVVKIAAQGTPPEAVARTTDLVRWLMGQGFPTVALHAPDAQPLLLDGHPITFWAYLPQPPDAPLTAAELAAPLRRLHRMPHPPVALPALDSIAAIRRSLAVATMLTAGESRFLQERAEQLDKAVVDVDFALPGGIVQGDPQHRNALRSPSGVVLCDWDTVAIGQPEWDLVTVEIHCRRFGHGRDHYAAFAAAYGFDVTAWAGYTILRDVRELRMIATNARKADRAPGTLDEVRRRIDGLRRREDETLWSIL